MKKILNKKGYTLIEVILSISIFSIALVMITNFYINFINFHNKIEKSNVANTSVINALNYIKYNIDETMYLAIVSEKDIEKYKNLGSDYSCIMLQDGDIIIKSMNEKTKEIILSKKDITGNIDLKFKKDEKYNNLTIELNILNEGKSLEKPLVSYIYMQNLNTNGIDIIGTQGVGIIYKNE